MARTGVLPPGIEMGSVPARLGAFLIDYLPPALIGGGLGGVLWSMEPSVEMTLVMSIGVGVLSLGWAVLCWWMLATRGATPGMKVTGLEFAGVKDGRPVGWGSALLRQLVMSVLAGTALGGIALVVSIFLNVRRQGWHDQAGRGVVIRRRVERRQTSEQPSTQQTSEASQAPSALGPVVDLPPHLRPQAPDTSWSQHSGQPWAGGQQAVPDRGQPQPAQSAPEWGQPQPIQSAPEWGQPAQPEWGQPQPIQSAPDWGQPQPAQSAPDWGQPQPAQSAPDWGQPQPAQSAPEWGQPQPAQSAPEWGQPQPAQSSPDWGQPAQPQWGQPQGDPHGQPAAPPTGGQDVDDEGDHTRIISPTGHQRDWVLTFDDGRKVLVNGLVLVGRNPQPADGEDVSELVKISDDTKTVSKTHLAIGVDSQGLWVSDRGSTNGSALLAADGSFSPCPVGDQVPVRPGQVVSFGARRFDVERV